jgi:hypothetical protein
VKWALLLALSCGNDSLVSTCAHPCGSLCIAAYETCCPVLEPKDAADSSVFCWAGYTCHDHLCKANSGIEADDAGGSQELEDGGDLFADAGYEPPKHADGGSEGCYMSPFTSPASWVDGGCWR